MTTIKSSKLYYIVLCLALESHISLFASNERRRRRPEGTTKLSGVLLSFSRSGL